MNTTPPNPNATDLSRRKRPWVLRETVIRTGEVFDTLDPDGQVIENGCVAVQDALGWGTPFAGLDSDGVLCQFTTLLVDPLTTRQNVTVTDPETGNQYLYLAQRDQFVRVYLDGAPELGLDADSVLAIVPSDPIDQRLREQQHATEVTGQSERARCMPLRSQHP